VVFKPRSITAERRSYGAAVSVNAKPQIKKPRKKKHTKRSSDMTVEEMLLESQKSSTRIYKQKKAEVFSKATEISDAQLVSLSNMIGAKTQHQIIRFIEFANQYPSGYGRLQKYPREGLGQQWLTQIHYRRARDMAMTGVNDLCNAEDEVAVSFGYDNLIDMLKDYISPRLL